MKLFDSKWLMRICPNRNCEDESEAEFLYRFFAGQQRAYACLICRSKYAGRCGARQQLFQVIEAMGCADEIQLEDAIEELRRIQEHFGYND